MHQNQSAFRPEGAPVLPVNAIAIVGMACRFASVRGPAEFWAMLREGKEAVQTFAEDELLDAGVSPAQLRKANYVRRGIPLLDMECFDAGFFGLSPREAAIMDPQHRHFLECAWEALENAGHTPERFGGVIGVFAGSGHNAYLPRNLMTHPKLVADVGQFLLRHTSNDKDFLTTRVSYLLDLKGPSLNVQTACSTSLVCVHMAAQSLLNGECDMALAGGATIELPHRHGYEFEPGEILSPDGRCRPFDAAAQGTMFGSGAAVLALRRLEDAIEAGDHIYAVVRGSAINNDGAGKVSYLAPSVDGQAQVIAEALAVAGIDADSIGYVEAHGTGTPLGDPIEVAALSQAFRESSQRTGYCAIGSVKGNIGHTDTAAGAAGLIKAALAIHHGELPASLNFSEPNPECSFAASPFFVQSEHAPWDGTNRPRRAGVSSLGVGGTNAHVVIEEPPVRGASGPSRALQLLVCSGRSNEALRANAASIARHFEAAPAINLADAAWSLSTGRRHLAHRRFVVAREVAEAGNKLRDISTTDGESGSFVANRPTAFLFCGAGAQHPDMALGLYQTEPVFRASVDEALALLDRLGNSEVRRWLFPSAADSAQAASELERPSVALPALFVIQVALGRYWMALGVRPTGMIGHSSGEYAAAHLAGVIDLESGLRIVSARGSLFETVEQGGMLSVPLSESELASVLPDELSIAAINGPSLCVVSGPADAIGLLHRNLAEKEIESQMVRISVAAHSRMLDPILPRFRALMGSIELRSPQLPFVSNVTGDWVTEREATDPEYWVRHLRQTVRFTDGLQRLFGDAEVALLEVGPGRGMSSLARQHPDHDRSQPVFSSLPHPGQAIADDMFFWNSVGQLWERGAPVDWDVYWRDEHRLKVPLPTYQFERHRHWIEPANATPHDEESAALGRRDDVADWRFEPVWRRTETPPSDKLPGPALVFEDRLGLGAEIVRRLRADGREVVSVYPGDCFHQFGKDRFAISPGNTADYRRLFETLAVTARLPRQIFHCWLVGDASSSRRHARQLLERGFHSLVAMAPALAATTGDDPVDMALVTNRLQRVADERSLEPEKATAVGAAGVIAIEYPNLHIRTVDVAPRGRRDAREFADLARALIGELAQSCVPGPIAYRAGERWVLEHERVPLPEWIEDKVPLLRTGGTYLITGGLGGLGLAIAKFLASTYHANLVLLSRTALPPRSRWADLLAGSTVDAEASDKIRKVLALEASGAKVELAVADVSDAAAVRRAVARSRTRLGPLTGVFHAAGTLDDGLIETKSRAAMEAVLRPKLDGTRALERALRRDQPEFLMLFSSVSAFAGLPGQADYAAANAFLDSYAQARHGDPATRVLSVGWSQWREVGMAAALRPSDAFRTELPLSDDRLPGHPWLESRHRLSDDELVVTAALSPDSEWVLNEHRVAGAGALLPGTAYLELARAAFQSLASGPVALIDVTFLTAFVVEDGTCRELRVQMRRRGKEDWRFSIIGRPAGDGAAPWIEHATGIARPLAECVTPAPIDIAQIAARCGRAVAGAPRASHVLRFGRRWSNIEQIAFGRHEALARLELEPEFHQDLEGLSLHPALLDMATAGAQSLIPGYDAATDFFAPFSYGEISVHGPLQAALVSHVRYRPPSGDGGSTAIFDVTIADREGAILAEVRGFTMMRVRDSSALAKAGQETGAPVSRASARGTGLDGILPEEGVRVVEELLGRRGGAHTIISPYSLRAMLELARAPYQAARQSGPGPSELPAAEQPASATERVVAALWQDLLGLDAIGRNDDFFDLGGHSLLAVQFTNRLRKQTGKSLPLAALLETPTVASIARILDPEDDLRKATGAAQPVAPAARPVTVIRDGGTQTPLFFVHDGLGETLLYRGLALRLDSGRPVLGLEPLRTAGGGFAHIEIAQMAAHYIERARLVQPHGPYLLAGLCAGGVIAFEMARQLQDDGEQVAFVGIVDAADVEAATRPFHVSRLRLDRITALIRKRSGPALVATLARKAANALAWEATVRLGRARDRKAVQRIRSANERGAAGSVSDSAELSFLKLYEVAHRRHRPTGLLSGATVALFKASQGNGSVEDIPYQLVYSDYALGWGKRVRDEIQIVSVPGGHSSLLQEPHVEALARRFQVALDCALSSLEQPETGAAEDCCTTIAAIAAE